jgi:uncharacterized protein with HEPN domain
MRNEKLYLNDIVEACEAVETFIGGLSKETVLNDDLILSAVIRKLEIIGEASSRLSADLRSAHPEIDWKAIIGLRNILAHQYFSCNLDITWEIAKKRVAPLRKQVEAIIARLGRDNS